MLQDNSEYPTERTSYERHVTRTGVPYGAYEQNVIDARQTYQEKKAVWRSYHIVWYIVGFITALLAFRFVFELLGANPSNAFVQMVYALSYPFAQPFQSIFGITSVARSTFDWSVIVAIAVYNLLGYALVRLLRIVRPVTPEEVNHRIRTV